MSVLRWARRRPELVILLLFALVVAVGVVRYQLRTRPVAEPDSSASPSVAAVVDSVAAVPDSPSSSAAQPMDLPQFDRAGSGSACTMTYGPSQSGGTVTTFTLNQSGELVAHVSGPDGLHRHDDRESEGLTSFSYDFPLSQVTDMGAALYLPDGSRQTCSIGPGS